MGEMENFVELSSREFKRLKELSDKAVAQVSDTQFFQALSVGDNSIAHVYKHLSGNLVSRWTDFLTSDGEKPYRNRDDEFTISNADSYESLISKWESAWKILFDTLDSLQPADLERPVMIRGESLSALQAISRQFTHYAYHVGQIVFMAKHLLGHNWKSLSIPLGESAAFNESPEAYLESK